MSLHGKDASLSNPNQWRSLVRMFSQSYDLVKMEETATEPDDTNVDVTDNSYIDGDSDFSSDSDDINDAELGIRSKTTVRTNIRRIKARSAKKKKNKIKNNKSLRDWWVWYWQAPKARFPFLYFLVLLISCIPFSVYWFMDNDSCFIACGIVALTMFIYATHKFRLSINLKQQVDKYGELNTKFKREQIGLEAQISRAAQAHKMLRHTKKRLARANAKNRENLKKFEQIENNLHIMGKEAGEKLKNVSAITQSVKQKWREELLESERELLHTVYNRFEKLHTGKSRLGLDLQDFKKFEQMLPERYGKRFDRLGTFHAFCGDRKCINATDFVNTLDTFAEMETDGADIEFILASKESMHPHMSSFHFTTSKDLWDDEDDVDDVADVNDSKQNLLDSPKAIRSNAKQKPQTPKKKRKRPKQIRFRK